MVDPVDERRRRPEARREGDRVGVDQGGRPQEQVDVGPAEAVQRLLGVADEEQLPGRRGAPSRPPRWRGDGDRRSRAAAGRCPGTRPAAGPGSAAPARRAPARRAAGGARGAGRGPGGRGTSAARTGCGAPASARVKRASSSPRWPRTARSPGRTSWPGRCPRPVRSTRPFAAARAPRTRCRRRSRPSHRRRGCRSWLARCGRSDVEDVELVDARLDQLLHLLQPARQPLLEAGGQPVGHPSPSARSSPAGPGRRSAQGSGRAAGGSGPVVGTRTRSSCRRGCSATCAAARR